MKSCPYCAEEVKEAAVKCRYCHSLIGDQPDLGPFKNPNEDPLSEVWIPGRPPLPIIWGPCSEFGFQVGQSIGLDGSIVLHIRRCTPPTFDKLGSYPKLLEAIREFLEEQSGE